MGYKDKVFEEKIELSPHDWLSWSDDKFNEWRRQHDFPRIVNFLLESLPYFSLWLSEQSGLTEQDLLFHGPARFIRFYGEPIRYVEHNESVSLTKNEPAKIHLRYYFLKRKEKQLNKKRIMRCVEFSSYIDWAFSNKNWVFPNKVDDLRGIVRCLTPSTRSCDTSINSNSSIEFNIPLFMPNVPIDVLLSSPRMKAPPRLELIKLGGGGIEIVEGLIGEKNLEFANIDNLTLVFPIITSYQNFIYSTLRNLNITGGIHAATFHQCSIEVNINDGSLSECKFEYGNSKINLSNSTFYKSLIKEQRLNLKLKDTEVISCCFKYFNIFGASVNDKESFNQSAKMIFSHLGYPDLAGEHFFLEQKEKRKGLWQVFSSFKKRAGLRRRASSLFGYIWMGLQELYWGYGEKPFNIICFSLFIIANLSLFGYFSQDSSTHLELANSVIFAFQSFTNISIKEIQQSYDAISLIGSFMSFIGVMSVGLLVAALSAKAKNYN